MIELVVVPDPLVFLEWRDVPIGGVPWRPWMAQPNRYPVRTPVNDTILAILSPGEYIVGKVGS